MGGSGPAFGAVQCTLSGASTPNATRCHRWRGPLLVLMFGAEQDRRLLSRMSSAPKRFAASFKIHRLRCGWPSPLLARIVFLGQSKKVPALADVDCERQNQVLNVSGVSKPHNVRIRGDFPPLRRPLGGTEITSSTRLANWLAHLGTWILEDRETPNRGVASPKLRNADPIWSH